MGAEYDHGTRGNPGQFIDEYGAPASEVVHDESVVDDLLPYINGGLVHREGEFHYFYGPLDSGAKTPWSRQQDSHFHSRVSRTDWGRKAATGAIP